MTARVSDESKNIIKEKLDRCIIGCDLRSDLSKSGIPNDKLVSLSLRFSDSTHEDIISTSIQPTTMPSALLSTASYVDSLKQFFDRSDEVQDLRSDLYTAMQGYKDSEDKIVFDVIVDVLTEEVEPYRNRDKRFTILCLCGPRGNTC